MKEVEILVAFIVKGRAGVQAKRPEYKQKGHSIDGTSKGRIQRTYYARNICKGRMQGTHVKTHESRATTCMYIYSRGIL